MLRPVGMAGGAKCRILRERRLRRPYGREAFRRPALMLSLSPSLSLALSLSLTPWTAR
ncbi:hypothetical protein JCM4914_72340 [Streptomyces platensis subsp. malvinus]